MKFRLIFLLLFTTFSFIFWERSILLIHASENLEEPQRLIVKFRKFTPGFYRKAILNKYKPVFYEELKLPDTFIVSIPNNQIADFIKVFRNNLLIEYSEKDYPIEVFEIPSDTLFSSQWGLTKIQADTAWNITHGDDGVDIAIVDSGINSSHPDLKNKIVASVNCTYSSCPIYTTSDPNGHGTHVAGIASAITGNNLGVAGVSWKGRLMSVRVLNNWGSGYTSWLINGIIWATDNGAEIINLSLGGSGNSKALEDAINYAWNKGVVIVAAAGNNSNSTPVYPAYYSNVIAVAAINSQDLKTTNSSYGDWVEVSAPGESILSSYKSDYAYASGTSMAAPFVSGLAALIKGQNPGWNNSQVRHQIESTSDIIEGTGIYWVFGRINSCHAVGCEQNIQNPTSTPTLTPYPTQTPTPTPLPTASPTATLPPPTPTSTLTPTPTPIPSPIPTTSKPWWCRYIPSHPDCR